MIRQTNKKFELDVKRCYLYDTIIQVKCPKCGFDCCFDANRGYYFSFPLINEPFNYPLCCQDEKCEYNWMIKLQITIKVEEVI